MEITWREEHLDYVLVPTALFILLAYHLLHLHRCVKLPLSTVIGYENQNRKAWVQRFLLVETKERGQAISVITSNISAATSLASISLVLSSLIGAWIGNTRNNEYIAGSIYGNTGPTIVYVKYVMLLAFFLIAFGCFIQTAKCFLQACFLISMPNCEMPVSNVESAVVNGSNYWTTGIRALYFAMNLLMWIFGPIPMFVASIVTVSLLQYLDRNGNRTPMPECDPPLREHDDSMKKKNNVDMQVKQDDNMEKKSENEKVLAKGAPDESELQVPNGM